MADRVQFNWRNGAGEHACTDFSRMVETYWAKVAQPALQAAEKEVQTWLAATTSDLSAVFVHSDMEVQHQVTALGMCLSLQALWERQLRRYLGSFVKHDPVMTRAIQMDHWDKLQRHFQEMRGVPLEAFIWYPDLDLLARLGNVCRHGDGRAADALWHAHPELWPDYVGRAGGAPSVEGLSIPNELLARLARAVAAFWEFVEYLYVENLQRKHSTVERDLPILRRQHAAAIAHFNSTLASL